MTLLSSAGLVLLADPLSVAWYEVALVVAFGIAFVVAAALAED